MDKDHTVKLVSTMRPLRSLRYTALALVIVPGLVAGADRNRVLSRAVVAAANQTQPIITILPAATGASLQSYSPGSAALSLGRATYYGGARAPGVAAKKNSTSLVISSRFGLQVTCKGATASSLAEVTISLGGIDSSYAVRVDGAGLASGPSVTVLRCGSVTEHVVEVEVPKTRPAGPLGGTLSFSAIPK